MGIFIDNLLPTPRSHQPCVHAGRVKVFFTFQDSDAYGQASSIRRSMMPYYREWTNFTQINNLNHPEFWVRFPVGSSAPKAGIYRCSHCGHEIAIAAHHKFPPDGALEHPKHNALLAGMLHTSVDYKWELVAQAKHVHDHP